MELSRSLSLLLFVPAAKCLTIYQTSRRRFCVFIKLLWTRESNFGLPEIYSIVNMSPEFLFESINHSQQQQQKNNNDKKPISFNCQVSLVIVVTCLI